MSAPFRNFLVALLLLMVSVSTLAALDSSCKIITATSIPVLERIFQECGSAVLQTEGVKPYMKRVAEILLGASGVVEQVTEPEFPADLHYFTPALRPAFLHADFPSFAAIAFVVHESLDAEFCLNTKELPCRPSDFRFVELEAKDILFIDPARGRFRICDPEATQAGCMPPKRVEVGQFIRYHSLSFLLPDNTHSKSVGVVVGDGDDQDSILRIATAMMKKQ